jgi:hypothetical protein
MPGLVDLLTLARSIDVGDVNSALSRSALTYSTSKAITDAAVSRLSYDAPMEEMKTREASSPSPFAFSTQNSKRRTRSKREQQVSPAIG